MTTTTTLSLCATLAAARLLDRLARREIACHQLRAYRVREPGRVLLDPAPRAARLAALPTGRRRALLGCGADDGGADAAASVAAVRRGEVAVGCRWLGRLLMCAVARYLAGDAAAGARAVAALRAWAEADAPTCGRPLGSPRARRDDLPDLRLALLPVLVACAALRHHPDLDGPMRQRTIATWLPRFIACAEVGCGFYWVPPAGGLGYHRVVDDAVAMAFGCLTGDDLAFRRGVERYLMALRQMRADGGWAPELACGRYRLWAHCRAVAGLVTIAELAAAQGYDLYGCGAAGGRSVHRAVEHLLDGVDAAEGADCGEAGGEDRQQDLGFLTRRADGRHPMAWIEPYLARFGGSGPGARLAGLRGGALLAERPLVDELGGGNATCLFAPLG